MSNKSPVVAWRSRQVDIARANLRPHALTISVLSPLLLGLAYPKVDFAPAAVFALVPLFLLWASLPWQRAFWWGWLAGALTTMLHFYWFANTLLSYVGSWSWVAMAALAAIEGLAVAAAATSAALVSRGKFRTTSIFAIPAAWVIFEAWRTSGSLGLPLGQIGAIAVPLPWLLPLAAYGGVYLLTAVIALVSSALAGVVAGDSGTRKAAIGALVAITVLVISVNVAQDHRGSPPPTLRIAVAQAAIAQQLKWTPAVFAYTMATYEDLTRQAASRGARVVVWPETSITSFPLQDNALLKRLESLSAKSHVWIMAGAIDRPSPAGYYNAVMQLTPAGSLGGVYHKHSLMPFAEYLPFASLWRRLGHRDDGSDFLAGPGPHLLSAAGYRLGTLICYESAFPLYARATTRAGADLLIVATDDDWFIGTPEPEEHADAARLQAVSTGRWVVRAAQSGISEIVDPRGNVTQQLGIGQQGFIVGDVGRATETPFDRYGIGWLLGLSAFVLIAGVVYRAR